MSGAQERGDRLGRNPRVLRISALSSSCVVQAMILEKK